MRRIKAFTIAETLTTLMIISIIAVMTVCSTVNSEESKIKQIKLASKTFYSHVEYAYQNILLRQTINNNITRMRNYDESVDSSEFLRDLFLRYMDGQKIDCPTFTTVDSENINFFTESGYSCAIFEQGIQAGFYLNLDGIEKPFQVIEYYFDDKNYLKTVDNAYGFIIYSTKNSKGIWGHDLFAIPLGKRSIK